MTDKDKERVADIKKMVSILKDMPTVPARIYIEDINLLLQQYEEIEQDLILTQHTLDGYVDMYEELKKRGALVEIKKSTGHAVENYDYDND